MVAITDNPVPFPYDGPLVLQGPLLRSHASVVDPELSLSIVDVV
jgi:hypothetical protein